MIANLTAIIATLTQQLQQANAVNNSGSGIPVDRQGQANLKWVNGRYVLDDGGYCWTNRQCVDINHDIRTCRIKKEGPVTRANNMGGN